MTSIEILINELKKYEGLENIEWFATKEIEQAKEMHKQEIIDAFKSGLKSPYHQDYTFVTQENQEGTKSGQYYQETFVSKGSDEHIVDTNKMIEVPQQETLYTEEQVQKMIDNALINYEIGWADRKKQQNLYTEKEIRKAIYGNPKFIFGKDQAESIIQSLKQPKK